MFALLLAPVHGFTPTLSHRPRLIAPRARTTLLDVFEIATTLASPVAEPLAAALATTPAAPVAGPVATGVVLAGAYVPASIVVKNVFSLAVSPVVKGITQSAGTVSSDRYQPGRKLGGGNFGDVYEDVDGGVVIKTANRNSRANEFAQAELFINQKLKLCGQSGVMASFEGHYFADGSLNLVWRREGSLTLDKALARGDWPWNVEAAVLGRSSSEQSLDARAAVIRRVSKQIFSNLAGVHEWGVVHRDVKGANLILAEDAKRFKLLDFGAACDLASGTNYDPTVQVFDPKFGPPEADPRSGGSGLVRGAGGKFDVFSAGLLVVQMCFKPYSTDAGIAQFKQSIKALGYDLKAWRAAAEQRKDNAVGFEILDKYGGMALLEGCLREDPNRRISAAAAARSRFCA